MVSDALFLIYAGKLLCLLQARRAGETLAAIPAADGWRLKAFERRLDPGQDLQVNQPRRSHPGGQGRSLA
jgi:hypothetical protein